MTAAVTKVTDLNPLDISTLHFTAEQFEQLCAFKWEEYFARIHHESGKNLVILPVLFEALYPLQCCLQPFPIPPQLMQQ
jgi:hypothetical protein